jgi:hypothetical protein
MNVGRRTYLALRRHLIFTGLLGAVAMAAVAVLVATAVGVTPPASPLELRINSTNCYTPNARIPVAVTAAPGASVNISTLNTAALTLTVDGSGHAAGHLIAPSRLPKRANFMAAVVTADAQTPDGGVRSTAGAFVLGTRVTCRQLRHGMAAGS